MLAAVLVALLQLVDQRQVSGNLAAQLLEANQGGGGCGGSRMGLLVLDGAVVHHAEEPYERRQGEALPDQRDEDHGEGEEDDEAAAGEWFAIDRHWQRERGEQGDRSTHAAPAQDE